MDYSLLPPLPDGARHISTIPEYKHLFGYAALPNGIIITCKPAKPTKGILYLDYWRIKRGYLTKSGYVILKTKTKGNGKCVTDKVHRIIGGLFIENHEKFPVINHKNGIKNDNRMVNLEWCSHKQNSIHCIENGLRNTAKGTSIAHSILNDDNVVAIFKMKANGLLNKDISCHFGIEISAISRILNRKSWKHVNIPSELYEKSTLKYKEIKSMSIGKKLNQKDVLMIRQMYKDGTKVKTISEIYKIDRRNCKGIIDRETWKNVK